MSKSGQNNYKGTNTQAWAAFALFLQYIDYSDFDFIGLEGEDLEDFHLVFTNAKKIIGESKAYKVGFPQIKTILDTILNSGKIEPQDEILIICTEADKKLKNLIKYLPYYDSKTTEKIVSEKSITLEQLKILPQVFFWEITQEKAQKIAEKLFAKTFRVWVPNHRVSEILRDLYEKEILQGSQNGRTLSRQKFLEKVEEKKRLIFEDEGYDKARVQKKKELKRLIQELKEPSSQQWKSNRLTTLSDNPDEHYWILKLLEEKKDLSLRHWDRLWKMSTQGTFVLEVFRIFKKSDNLSITDNQDYFIELAPQLLEQSSNFFREEFIKTDIADICKTILESTRKHDSLIFELIKNLFEPSVSKYFYTKHRQDSRYEWEEISKVLLELYQKTIEPKLKNEIFSYIFSKFNLIEDEWKYWHYSPPSVFQIIHLHFENNPSDGLLELTPLFSQQFNAFYKQFGKKLEFNGWEHMGGGISQSGKDFSIEDRHFVGAITKPLIQKLYDQDPDKCWEFLTKNCITMKLEDISDKKPDFLNRSSLSILFREYKAGTHSKEAFEILSSFIKMRKGIPWKVDLIFQELRKVDYSTEQKWALIKVSLDDYSNLPVNVFVEQIVSDLAKSEYKEALTAIGQWVKDPEYNRRQTIGSFNVMENISKLLDNPKTFDVGVEIYKSYITGADFVEKNNDWETWDIARVLAKIISVKPEVGIEIIKEVSSATTLTQNQQTLICSSINDLPKDRKEILEKVYQGFLLPFLQSLDSDISKVEGKITNRHSREQIVQFAEKLAEAKCFEEAFYLLKIFVKDSDPILECYSDDLKGDFNYHQKVIDGDDNPTINTVRGYCAWVLQKFATLYGRKYIHDIIPLVELLAEDPNYYVRVQSCIPLMELAKNRNTVLPDNRKERFVSLKTAQKVEGIAFNMLRSTENHKLPAVMKHLAMVFTYMRTISQANAWEVIQIFLKNNYPKKTRERGHESYLADVLSEAAPLYVFFAEFREKSFKDWPKEWGDLGLFDSSQFKILLKSLLTQDNPEIRHLFSWQFARLPDEVKETPEFDAVMKFSASYLELATSSYDHETFDDIYRFIEDYIDQDQYFKLCFDLWTRCILTEEKFFKNNYSKDKLLEMYWWPFFYNGKIIVKIAEMKGSNDFLFWFKKLVDYPTDILIANDLDVAVEYLINLTQPRQDIEELFDKLMQRNPKYYEYKQRWLQLVS